MAQEPKLTVSGYRGIWGESLTPLIVESYVRAFIEFVREDINKKPTILIGRDGRESGPEIKTIVIKTLNGLGVNFIDGDILPTPTVLFAVRKHKYDGAIIITASHNPREYNGLKFVTNKALFTDEKEVAKIKEKYNKLQQNILSKSTHKTLLGFCSARPVGLHKAFIKNVLSSFIRKENMLLKCLGSATARARGIFQQKNIRAFQKHIFLDINNNFPKEHADQILKHINVEKIREKKFKVAVDMINASACVLDPYLFDRLGVELIPLNNIPDGKFAHKPEPLRENLGDIARFVKEKNCDLGFAHDPDADRLVVVNERGEVISEEYTLALGVEAILSKNPGGTAVVNMSTSGMNKDIAEKYGGKCIRTKVGEANVVAGILDNKAIIGGEGGGGIIYPAINTARDSFVSLALILELLAERNQTVTECIETLPKYEMLKDKVSVSGSLEEMYKKMKDHFFGIEVNELDGLRLDFPDSSWIHLRPSNTEPIIRLYGEAKNKEKVEALFKETHKLLA